MATLPRSRYVLEAGGLGLRSTTTATTDAAPTFPSLCAAKAWEVGDLGWAMGYVVTVVVVVVVVTGGCMERHCCPASGVGDVLFSNSRVFSPPVFWGRGTVEEGGEWREGGYHLR